MDKLISNSASKKYSKKNYFDISCTKYVQFLYTIVHCNTIKVPDIIYHVNLYLKYINCGKTSLHTIVEAN